MSRTLSKQLVVCARSSTANKGRRFPVRYVSETARKAVRVSIPDGGGRLVHFFNACYDRGAPLFFMGFLNLGAQNPSQKKRFGEK